MFEEKGKSCDDVIQGKSLKATCLCYKQVAPEQSCMEKVREPAAPASKATHTWDSSWKAGPSNSPSSWLNPRTGAPVNTVPGATDSAFEKVHGRKSIHGKNESWGHSVRILPFMEK